VGPTYLTIMLILLLVSLFAAMLAFHNSATRYLYSLGRARILPPVLARTGSNGTPVTAGLVQAGFAALVALAFMFAGANPLEAIVPPMLGFGTLSIIVLQTLAALSIFVHFRRSRSPKILTTLVAPLISFLLLGTIVVMAIANFDIVAGSDALIIRLLPWLLAITAVGGLIYGAWLKANRPNIYAGLADDLEQFDPSSDPEAPSPVPEA
jgi:amino acid transporter